MAFEDDYLGRNNLQLPSLFYALAEVTPGVTPEDICDAVLAAWEAAPDAADPKQVLSTYHKFLGSFVVRYAEVNGLTPIEVCDALLTCAQFNEGVEKRKREREEDHNARRGRSTTL